MTYGIVANVLSDHVLRTGARVWIHRCNGDATRPFVSGASKGGRVVGKYANYKRLTNFRSAWIPEHMRDRVGMQWENRADAEERAAALSEMWAGIRFFHRNGTLLQDGAPESAAFERFSRGSNA